MKKVRIYTRTGDKGQTSLFGGKRIRKDDLRVEAYGTVDELNAVLGVTVSFLKDKKIHKIIQKIQNELFNIGAELANPLKVSKNTKALFLLDKDKIVELEQIIDQLDKSLPPLRVFILPSGTNAASLIHLARSTTRRAERRLVALSRKNTINPNILTYINRLSDLLFVASRYLNHKSGVKESPWGK